jgi:lipopolysaccharide/colanic/teichoic acid biosynthesis glycosyltransferase
MSIGDISLPPENGTIVATPCEASIASPLETERPVVVHGEKRKMGSDISSVLPTREQGGTSGAAKDVGGWLLIDLFVRHARWTRLAALDPKEIYINEGEGGRIANSILKRSVDCMIALSLLVVLLPLLIMIAVVIRLESRGPALFRHSRVGRDGRQFEMWKFRSMWVEEVRYERSPASKMDKRLTRVGRILRRISLDELPQLLNVVKGDMSLVGPRPEMPFIVDGYGAIERQRLVVRPGLTGLWQISSCRAAPIPQNLQYDLYYIRNHSVLLDAAILVRTISAVIRGVGAV